MKTLSSLLVLALFASTAIFAIPGEVQGDSPTSGLLFGLVTNAETGDPLPGVAVIIPDINVRNFTDVNGEYEIRKIPAGTYEVRISFVGFQTIEREVTISDGVRTELNMALRAAKGLSTIVAQDVARSMAPTGVMHAPAADMASRPDIRRWSPDWNTEDYALIEENDFRVTRVHPLSTFSIDVDAASYSNLRRFIESGQAPPKDAVRIEEMINYFNYDYPSPEGEHPFSITIEGGDAPWNTDHRLLHIGLQGQRIPQDERPANNLVFLLDVSGSMSSPYKLPLLKKAFRMLVDEMRPEDRVAIVVYAGAAGLVLESTPGDEKEAILGVLNKLRAGGNTAGAAGIKLAYEVALENYIEEGNNRVILATDGDFNVGVSSTAAMVRLIEDRRDEGVFLTVLGFGTGNLKDAKMEAIANHGNGNYYYIDSELEAQKVLVRELGSTLLTIAKDVKIQVEFNPTKVASYRLIGYENRLLASEDFADDEKDAGELGAGHSVTALYEIIPVGAPDAGGSSVDLKYQDRELTDAALSDELVTVRLRYKQPQGETSRLIERTYVDADAESISNDFAFSAAVAAFGMHLRGSKYKGNTTLERVLAWAREGQGEDPWEYRASFIDMVEAYRRLDVAPELTSR